MQINDFTLTELTHAINQFPVQWGRINQMGLFADRGVRTRTVTVEEQSGSLVLLPDHEWGGEGTVASKIARNTYSFAIKQTAHEDNVMPGDMQDVRGFGIEGLTDTSAEIARRLQRMRARHDITKEWKLKSRLPCHQPSCWATHLKFNRAIFKNGELGIAAHCFNLGAQGVSSLLQHLRVVELDDYTRKLGNCIDSRFAALGQRGVGQLDGFSCGVANSEAHGFLLW